jgi:hypothetical protein
MKASPAFTMIGSFRSTRPPSPTIADDRRRQHSQPLAVVRVDLEDRYPPSGLDALQMEARNDPVFSEAEGEVEVFVKGSILLFFRPHSYFTVILDLDMDYVRMAADRAILDVLLA